MTRPKAIPLPSPSSSASESETTKSSSDEDEQQKEAVRTKVSPSPVKKKPVVVPKQQQNMVPQERIASPPPAKKKSVVKNNKKPPPPAPCSAAPAADASSSEEEDASDSPPKAKPTPSFSRPRKLNPSTSTEPTGFSKPEVPTPAAASPQSHKAKERKRQLEEVGDIQEGDAAADGRSSSKKLFQRVWTVENEIALLKGMLDFQEKHGGPLRATISDAAFKFISSTLKGDFSKMQLYSKIRALRKRYETNLRRGNKDADPSFAKSHEQVAFNLSMKLWPAGEGDAHDYRGNGTSANPKDRERKAAHQGASPLYPSLLEAISLLGKEDDNSFLAQTASRALESLKSTKLKALEDRWSKHFIAGVNYFMERARLKKDLLQSLVGTIDSE